jgi:hypothetical protein
MLALGFGCSSLELEQRNPDGSIWRQKSVVFAPDVELRPNEFTVSSGGVTKDGFPIEVLTPNSGKGPTYYRVLPPDQPALQFRGVQPARRVSAPLAQPSIADQPATTRTSQLVGFDAFRVHVDMQTDTAALEVRFDEQPWRMLAQGSIDTVARAALQAGIHPVEFRNEFGCWQVTADPRFPMLCTRLNGGVVNVRGIP